MNIPLEARERGSILALLLVLGMGLAFLLTFILQQGRVEARSARTQRESVRAFYAAYGELEKAQRMLAESEYTTDNKNSILQAALARPDGRIPGSNVYVEPLADGGWFNMFAAVSYGSDYQRVVRQVFRECDSFASYNLFVDQHPVGISGTPSGAIHSNRRIQFFFAGGSYAHSVSAVEGFEFLAGATPDNTTLNAANSAAAEVDLQLSPEDDTHLDELRTNALPELTFDETVDLKIDLYVNDGSQWIEIERWSKPEVTSITEDVVVGYEQVNPDEGPIYESQTREVKVPGQLLETRNQLMPENGLIFSGGEILRLEGEVIGRLTIASAESIRITGNIVYQDEEGDAAMLNGDKPWLPYEENPDYDNRATLGVIAQKDVLYTTSVPENFELHAALLAVTGRVGIEGITLDADGNVTAYDQLLDPFGDPRGGTFKKNSIRRFGGITTALRPVETYVESGILSGFNTGRSAFDRNLIDGPPPFFLTRNRPRFLATSLVE